METNNKENDKKKPSEPKSLEELLGEVNNRYLLVMAVARRAKQLSQGASPLVKSKFKKATSIALEEILRGKVVYGEAKGEEGNSEEQGSP